MTREEFNRLGIVISVWFCAFWIFLAIVSGAVNLAVLLIWLIAACVGALIGGVYLRHVVKIARALDQGEALEEKLKLYASRRWMVFPGQFLILFLSCVLLSWFGALEGSKDEYLARSSSTLGILGLSSIIVVWIGAKYLKKYKGLDLQKYLLL